MGLVTASVRSTAADHAHDLDGVSFFQCHCFVPGALDDRAVVLDGDRARVDAELLEVREQRCRALELHVLPIDPQGDHLNIPIAA